MIRKMTVIALSAILMLYDYSEPHANPTILVDDNDFRNVEMPVFPAGSKANPAVKPATATATDQKKTKDEPRPPFPGKPPKIHIEREGRNSLSDIALQRWHQMGRIYVRRTKRPLIATSFKRTPMEQARAMRNNIRRYGVRYVLGIYRHSAAAREIIWAYSANHHRPQQALTEMSHIISTQVARGVYVSDHLRGNAVDIRSRGRNGARLAILREAAHEVGATVLKEIDHYHVRLV
jgi:hypothetical protein